MGDEHHHQSENQYQGHRPPELPPHLASEWLSVTLFSIGDAVIATNTESLITFMNPVAESLTGWSASEADRQPLEAVFNIVNEQTRRQVPNPLIKAIREGVIVGLANHTILIARDGTEHFISDSAAPIRDDRGDIAGAVLVFRDISEQRRAEHAKQAALDFADNIVATLRHPFLVLNGELRVISANGSFYRTFHTSPEETQGEQVYRLGNGQWNIPRLRTLLEEILPQNNSFEDFEVQHEFPHIGPRDMLLNARCMHGEDEKTELILLGIEDITERRELERKRRELETHFTSLVKTIRDHAIFTLDQGGHIRSWNVEAERILGYTEEEALGKHFSLIFTAEDIENEIPLEELRLARLEGRAEDERWHKRKNGELFWALGIVTPAYDDQGNLTGFSKILRDITDRKRMEESLKAADRHKDEFLAILSHELRNPLAPILHAVQFLATRSDDNDEYRTANRVIERQVRHLKHLVDDLLEISRISTGRIHLQKSQVLLNEALERSVERLRPHIQEHKQSVSLTVPENPIWIDGDATRMEQVIGNLLINASKYNEPGGHIWISLEADHSQAVIRVRDDGMGMSPEFLPSIFDLFTQADRSLDRAEGGLGIGLALVRKLVELHEGTVEAFSAGTGQGSEFVVRLPRNSPSPSNRESGAPNGIRAATPQKILVVDDRIDGAEMMAMLLRSWGHEVRIEHNGPNALHRAGEFLPDVILLDIGLPEMNGYEVARRLRQETRLADVRLVAITGYGQEEDRERSRMAGFNIHLVKPVDATDLKEALAKGSCSP
jgi:PAS domain S-box-containing protein